jgi:hypothetical protein
MTLYLQEEMYPEDEHKQLDDLYRSMVVERKVVMVATRQQTQTLSASTAITPIQLSQFADQDVGALHVYIRSSTSNTSGRLRILQTIGPNGSFSIELNNENFEMLGNQILKYQLKQNDNAFHYVNPEHQRYYPSIDIFYADPALLFTQSTSTNIRRFNGNELLKITPDAVGTNEIQTITLTNAGNDGGYYQLAFRGDIMSSLVYNANAAAIKAALEALPSMKRSGLTVTASAAATSTFTLTFAPPHPIVDLVTIIPTSLNKAATFEIGSSAVTTPGVDGFTAGTYTIDIYALCFQDAHINPSGKIDVYQNFQ